MLLVVHVPKTAGTSLRIALEAEFGFERVARDYGGQSEETSRLVREQLYSDSARKDVPGLIAQLRDSGYQALMGHFLLKRYSACFEPGEMLAFIRDPLVRACSEWLHRTRHGTFTGSFQEFLSMPQFQNVQARHLEGRPEGMFIGLTERYREALERINARFGLQLTAKTRNRDWSGGGKRLAGKLEPGLIEQFEALNQEDLRLYREVEAAFS
jgi:hypothetical protein